MKRPAKKLEMILTNDQRVASCVFVVENWTDKLVHYWEQQAEILIPITRSMITLM